MPATPATVTTKEPIGDDVDAEGVKREIALRIQAGAIRAWVEPKTPPRFLLTEWNVIGSNDKDS